MTIKVTIENNDANRVVVVDEMLLNKNTGRRERADTAKLRPGERRSFHVHLLKDLHVSEQEP